MDGADKNAVIFLDTEVLQAAPQFASAFVAVGDASDAPWGSHVLCKDPGKLNGERFCLSAAWTRQHNAVPNRFVGGPLAGIISKFFRRLQVSCAHVQSR